MVPLCLCRLKVHHGLSRVHCRGRLHRYSVLAPLLEQQFLMTPDEEKTPSATGNQMRRFLGLPQRGVETVLESALAPISYPARAAEAAITQGLLQLPADVVIPR